MWLSNIQRLVAFYNFQLGVICPKHKWIRLQIERSEIPSEGTRVNKEGTKFQYCDPLHLCIPLCFATWKAVESTVCFEQ